MQRRRALHAVRLRVLGGEGRVRLVGDVDFVGDFGELFGDFLEGDLGLALGEYDASPLRRAAATSRCEPSGAPPAARELLL